MHYFLKTMHKKHSQIVSITSQGQITIPKFIRRDFGITGSVKAVVSKAGDKIVVEPKQNFWQLSGSLGSEIKLTDAQLKKARAAFTKNWARK